MTDEQLQQILGAIAHLQSDVTDLKVDIGQVNDRLVEVDRRFNNLDTRLATIDRRSASTDSNLQTAIDMIGVLESELQTLRLENRGMKTELRRVSQIVLGGRDGD